MVYLIPYKTFFYTRNNSSANSGICINCKKKGLLVGLVSLGEIQVTPLQRINVSGGDVLHAIKKSDPSFSGFGEAYFSWVNPSAIKAWKYHRQMTLNLVVPVGEVNFVFHDINSRTFREVLLGENNYIRLTVPPRIWFGFQGCSTTPSLVLNISDIPHDPKEAEAKNLNEIKYQWH